MVAEALDGDPERVAVGRLRERERVLRVPEAPGQEAPEEELSRFGAEPLEAAAADPERDDAGRLLDHLDDPQVVAGGLYERPRDAVAEDEREREREEAAPVVGRDPVDHELVAGRDHVEPGERDPRVGGEVDRVPPLVRELAAHDHDRGHDDSEQQGGPDRGGDHAGVGGCRRRGERTGEASAAAGLGGARLGQRQPVPVLAEERVLVLPGVAPDREDDVRQDQADHRVAVPAVPDRQPVEADETLEERQPREQEHLDQRQVAGKERRQPPQADQGGVEVVPVVAEAVGAAAAPDQEDPGGIADEEDHEREPDPASPRGVRGQDLAARGRWEGRRAGGHQSSSPRARILPLRLRSEGTADGAVYDLAAEPAAVVGAELVLAVAAVPVVEPGGADEGPGVRARRSAADRAVHTCDERRVGRMGLLRGRCCGALSEDAGDHDHDRDREDG